MPAVRRVPPGTRRPDAIVRSGPRLSVSVAFGTLSPRATRSPRGIESAAQFEQLVKGRSARKAAEARPQRHIDF